MEDEEPGFGGERLRLRALLRVEGPNDAARFACRLSDRVYVIDKGRIRFEGAVAQLEAEEELKSRYLAV